MEYRVVWKIDIVADSFEEAAREALDNSTGRGFAGHPLHGDS